MSPQTEYACQSQTVPCGPGDTYYASAYVHTTGMTTGDAMIGIVFWDANGNELDTLSNMAPLGDGALFHSNSQARTRIATAAIAPPGAVEVEFFIQSGPCPQGAVASFDSITFTKGTSTSWNDTIWNRDVVYLDGRAIAEIDAYGIHELHCDHLGTPRIITNGTTGAQEGMQTYAPYGELLAQVGYVPLIGFTGHIQTEPNGLIYMKGRFYSPAWHYFLSPDPGGDPNQWSRYAYAGGNPLVYVDPSGMSFISDLWGDLTKAVHQVGHAIGVNWNHGRKGIEIGVAVAICIVLDVASDGAASGTNEGIMASVGAGVNAVGGPVVADALVGAAAGGAIGGTWKSAAEGAMLGASLGYGYTWWTEGGGTFSGFWQQAKVGLSDAFGPVNNMGKNPIWYQYMMKALGTGISNVAMHGGSPWVQFRNGLIEGTVLGAAGYSELSDLSTVSYFGLEMMGEYVYRFGSKLPTHIGDATTPLINAGLYGLGPYTSFVDW